MPRPIHQALLAAALLAGLPATGAAQDHVVLAEVIPALAGTELGALELGPAPPPGASRVVRRSEVLSALRRAGRDPRGLAIPRTTRIRRDARRLDADALEALSRDAIAEALAPCSMSDLRIDATAVVARGELAVRVEGGPPPRSGPRLVVVILSAAGRETRVPAQARVECPAPVVRPGARVRVIARFGSVEASAPGVARQPGRVGDVIRVRGGSGRASLRARVIDAQTVEVVP